MNRPISKVAQDWKGLWGVKVKWPRSGRIWTRRMPIWPRYAWYGPFGDSTARAETREPADWFKDIFDQAVAKVPEEDLN